jgi:nicotinamidase-related amidase
MYTLIVVDMQPGFDAAWDARTIENCIAYVKQAKKDKATIIIMEYGYDNECTTYGKTHKSITKYLSRYKNYYRVVKRQDDGSSAVLTHEVAFHFKQNDVRVCGVNTTACVARTALGMKERFNLSNVKVLLDACNQPNDFGKIFTREMIQAMKNSNVLLENSEYLPLKEEILN